MEMRSELGRCNVGMNPADLRLFEVWQSPGQTDDLAYLRLCRERVDDAGADVAGCASDYYTHPELRSLIEVFYPFGSGAKTGMGLAQIGAERVNP
jgi:hypothetical protein